MDRSMRATLPITVPRSLPVVCKKCPHRLVLVCLSAAEPVRRGGRGSLRFVGRTDTKGRRPYGYRLTM